MLGEAANSVDVGVAVWSIKVAENSLSDLDGKLWEDCEFRQALYCGCGARHCRRMRHHVWLFTMRWTDRGEIARSLLANER